MGIAAGAPAAGCAIGAGIAGIAAGIAEDGATAGCALAAGATEAKVVTGCPTSAGFAAGKGEDAAGCATASVFVVDEVAAGFGAGGVSCTFRRFSQASADELSCANDLSPPTSKEVPASPTATTPPSSCRAERAEKVIPNMSPNFPREKSNIPHLLSAAASTIRHTLTVRATNGQLPDATRLVANNGHIRAKE